MGWWEDLKESAQNAGGSMLEKLLGLAAGLGGSALSGGNWNLKGGV